MRTFATYGGLRAHLRASHYIREIPHCDQSLYAYDPDSPIVLAMRARAERRVEQNRRSANKASKSDASNAFPMELFGQFLDVIGRAMVEGIERGVRAAFQAQQVIGSPGECQFTVIENSF